MIEEIKLCVVTHVTVSDNLDRIGYKSNRNVENAREQKVNNHGVIFFYYSLYPTTQFSPSTISPTPSTPSPTSSPSPTHPAPSRDAFRHPHFV